MPLRDSNSTVLVAATAAVAASVGTWFYLKRARFSLFGTRHPAYPTKAALLAARKRYTSSSLSISYENSNPLWIVEVCTIPFWCDERMLDK